MGAAEVVVAEPRLQRLGTVGAVAIRTDIGPLAQYGLNETFCFAVGARRVRTSEAVLDAQRFTGAPSG